MWYILSASHFPPRKSFVISVDHKLQLSTLHHVLLCKLYHSSYQTSSIVPLHQATWFKKNGTWKLISGPKPLPIIQCARCIIKLKPIWRLVRLVNQTAIEANLQNCVLADKASATPSLWSPPTDLTSLTQQETKFANNLTGSHRSTTGTEGEFNDGWKWEDNAWKFASPAPLSAPTWPSVLLLLLCYHPPDLQWRMKRLTLLLIVQSGH